MAAYPTKLLFSLGIIVLLGNICPVFGITRTTATPEAAVEWVDTGSEPGKGSGVDTTGMAFVRPPWKLDTDFFFSLEPVARQRRSAYTILDLVWNFIRNVKGLPVKPALSKDDSFIEARHFSDSNISVYRKRLEWVYNPYLLEDLVKVELKIYELLHGHPSLEQSTPFFLLESYLKDFEDSSVRAIRRVEASNRKLNASSIPENPHLYVATHPLLVYRMIRRFSEDIPTIFSAIAKGDKDLRTVLGGLKLVELPNSKDFQEMLLILHRLQFGNDLDSYHMAVGVLGDISTHLGVNALHCLEIGTTYLGGGYYTLAIHWLHQAHEIVTKSKHLQSYVEIEEFVRGIFHIAIVNHNKNFHNQLDIPYIFNDTIQIFDKPVAVPFQPKEYTRRVEQLSSLALEHSKRNNSIIGWVVSLNQYRLCAGENVQTDAEKAALKCLHYIPHIYWLLHPLQAEILVENPRLLQVYNFVGAKLIARVQMEATPNLERSQLHPKNDGNYHSDTFTSSGEIFKTRTSVQSWLDESDEHGFLKAFTRKLELLTGLYVMHPRTRESHQVAAYGSAAYFSLHVDAKENSSHSSPGNRITTIMTYLNDVKAGGYTVFPMLGTFVKPTQGSIVVWNSLMRNGKTVDYRTYHAGCPVTLGMKWIMNKWVHYDHNMFTYRCSLKSDE